MTTTTVTTEFAPPTPGSAQGTLPGLPNKPLPPVTDRPGHTALTSVIETARSYFTSAAGVLPSSSLAYLSDPNYQRMMRADADVESVLRALLVILAGLDWSVAPKKEYENDANAKKLAIDISRTISSAPRLSELWMNLAQAAWYGPAATNIVYARDPRIGVRITALNHFHADTLAWDLRGNLGLRVGAAFTAAGGQPVTGFSSQVSLFDQAAREAVVLHRVFAFPGDFDDAYAAERQFRGVGARDAVWYLWLLKQEFLRCAANFAELYSSGGLLKGWYPMSDATAAAEMIEILRNIRQRGAINLPFKQGTPLDQQPNNIEAVPLSGSAGDVYMAFVEWIGQKIKECIIGQSLSSSSHGGGGIGQGTAMLHADTLRNIVNYHARAMGDSVTLDMVRIIARMLGASDELQESVELSFAVSKADTTQFMAAVSQAVGLGVDNIPRSEVVSRLGIRPAEKGEAVLGIAPADPLDEALRRG